MTIANGSVILGSELFSEIDSRRGDLITDSLRLHHYQVTCDFVGVAVGTALELRQQSFTVPDDMDLYALSGLVEAGTAAEIAYTLSGPLVAPLARSTAAGTGVVTLPTPVGDFAGVHTLLKGATYTVTVSNDNAAARTIRVFVGLRAPARDY